MAYQENRRGKNEISGELNGFLLDFLRYCGSCPFASLLAFVLLVTGTGVFCGCLYYPIRVSIDQINNAFEVEFIDYEW